MKQTLLILNILLILLGLSSCNTDIVTEKNDLEEEDLNPFFTSDSTVFYNLNVRKETTYNDSILSANGFVNQHSKDSLIYYENIDKGYYLRLKLTESSENYQRQIENEMSKLYAFSKTEKFWYGIQIIDNKPIQEIYLIKHKGFWEIKVFRRNRF